MPASCSAVQNAPSATSLHDAAMTASLTSARSISKCIPSHRVWNGKPTANPSPALKQNVRCRMTLHRTFLKEGKYSGSLPNIDIYIKFYPRTDFINAVRFSSLQFMGISQPEPSMKPPFIPMPVISFSQYSLISSGVP